MRSLKKNKTNFKIFGTGNFLKTPHWKSKRNG